MCANRLALCKIDLTDNENGDFLFLLQHPMTSEHVQYFSCFVMLLAASCSSNEYEQHSLTEGQVHVRWQHRCLCLLAHHHHHERPSLLLPPHDGVRFPPHVVERVRRILPGEDLSTRDRLVACLVCAYVPKSARLAVAKL